LMLTFPLLRRAVPEERVQQLVLLLLDLCTLCEETDSQGYTFHYWVLLRGQNQIQTVNLL
jgi:hypothetical protein